MKNWPYPAVIVVAVAAAANQPESKGSGIATPFSYFAYCDIFKK